MKKKILFLVLLCGVAVFTLWGRSSKDDPALYAPKEFPATADEIKNMASVAKLLTDAGKYGRWYNVERSFALTPNERSIMRIESGTDPVAQQMELLKSKSALLKSGQWEFYALGEKRHTKLMKLKGDAPLAVTLVMKKGKYLISSVEKI